MYEVYVKSWYQEHPNDIEEEILYSNDDVTIAFNYMKKHSDFILDFYPLIEFGVRIKK